MSITKQNILILLVLVSALFVGSCRKQYHATEEDMADYGWFLFESAAIQSDYTNSKNWFLSSVNEDTMYMDGYNGLGWSYGKITDLDSSLYYFEKGLNFLPSLYDTTNLHHEIWAGLCFVNNAMGLDSLAIIWGNNLINSLTTGLSSNPWIFTHNNINSSNIINLLDLRVTMAASHFAEGEFDNSVAHLRTILTELSGSSTFNPDVNTVSGRYELAVWIDSLQTILLTQ